MITTSWSHRHSLETPRVFPTGGMGCEWGGGGGGGGAWVVCPPPPPLLITFRKFAHFPLTRKNHPQ